MVRTVSHVVPIVSKEHLAITLPDIAQTDAQRVFSQTAAILVGTTFMILVLASFLLMNDPSYMQKSDTICNLDFLNTFIHAYCVVYMYMFNT